VTTAREDILARIRATTRTPSPEPPRAYRRHGQLPAPACVNRFCERVTDYRAAVRRIDPTEIAAAVEAVCAGGRIGIPPDLPREWRPSGCELVPDERLSPRELDGLDGILTGCTVAIAETGTIILAAGPEEGRLALTLIPDRHICVVRTQQIVETVPEALAAVADLVRTQRRPLTLVSGPSATSDIELSRVEGVHGPRSLVVLVAEETTP
jgi:L-lactate dehydrogenase complex protein LldG